MAWIELHQNLPQHLKVSRFRRQLRISVPQAIGHLSLLWLWALDYAPTGDLSALEPAEVSDAALWTGDAELFLQALKTAGFVEEDGQIHDWMDYAGQLIETRRQDRERKRLKRGVSAGCPPDVRRTATGFRPESAVTQPNPTQPNPTQPEENGAGAPPPVSEIPKKTLRMQKARPVLFYLNEKAGRQFRETEQNLLLIAARMAEVNDDTEGIRQMIDRMCAKWKTDPQFAEYLRPETLFNKTKFASYYDNRNLPVATGDQRGPHANSPSDRRNAVIATTPAHEAASKARIRELEESSGRPPMEVPANFL